VSYVTLFPVFYSGISVVTERPSSGARIGACDGVFNSNSNTVLWSDAGLNKELRQISDAKVVTK
jgi:hypothetical protein